MEQKEMKTGALLKRFVPYYKKYVRIMVFDLLCASLTTVCELVLPLILRYITNQGLKDLASLTVRSWESECSTSPSGLSTVWPASTWRTPVM